MKNFFVGMAIVVLSSSAWAQAKSRTQSKLPVQPPVPLEKSESVTPSTEPIGIVPPTDTSPATGDITTVTPNAPDLSTRALRGLTLYSGTLHFSPISTWLPFKYGLALGYNYNPDWTIEGEWTQKTYSAGVLGVDFGSVTDQRYGIQTRWSPGTNSFHFIFGLYKSQFSAELGGSILARMGAPSGTAIGFSSFGPLFGIGNRWQWRSGITFGMDWVSMYIPAFGQDIDDEIVRRMTNQTDRSNLEDALSKVQNIPQFDLLKINLGYSF